MTVLPPVASAAVIDNPGTLVVELANTQSPFLEFADGSMLYQTDETIDGVTQSNGQWDYATDSLSFGDVFDGGGSTVLQVNGGNLQALLEIWGGTGTVDGITGEVDWVLEARIKFLFPASGTCNTGLFDITIAGNFMTSDEFYSDPIEIPALTSGCGNATNRGTINTALSLGTSGAELVFYKFDFSPVPFGS